MREYFLLQESFGAKELVTKELVTKELKTKKLNKKNLFEFEFLRAQPCWFALTIEVQKMVGS